MDSIKALFRKPYDFSQWDRDRFPLGMSKTIRNFDDDKMEEIVDQRVFVVSPEAAWLLAENKWHVDFIVDENIKFSTPNGKSMTRGGMYRYLFSDGGILSERAA